MKKYRITEKCPQPNREYYDFLAKHPKTVYDHILPAALAAGWIEEIKDPIDELFDDLDWGDEFPGDVDKIKKHWQAREHEFMQELLYGRDQHD